MDNRNLGANIVSSMDFFIESARDAATFPNAAFSSLSYKHGPICSMVLVGYVIASDAKVSSTCIPAVAWLAELDYSLRTELSRGRVAASAVLKEGYF